MSLRLLCDEDVPGAVFRALREWGHDAARTILGGPDTAVAERARQEGRIIITCDSDFANILSFPPPDYHGIVRIRVHPPRIELVIPALKRLFDAVTAVEEFKGKLFIVEAHTFRVWP